MIFLFVTSLHVMSLPLLSLGAGPKQASWLLICPDSWGSAYRGVSLQNWDVLWWLCWRSHCCNRLCQQVRPRGAGVMSRAPRGTVGLRHGAVSIAPGSVPLGLGDGGCISSASLCPQGLQPPQHSQSGAEKGILGGTRGFLQLLFHLPAPCGFQREPCSCVGTGQHPPPTLL